MIADSGEIRRFPSACRQTVDGAKPTIFEMKKGVTFSDLMYFLIAFMGRVCHEAINKSRGNLLVGQQFLRAKKTFANRLFFICQRAKLMPLSPQRHTNRPPEPNTPRHGRK
jgi:hypothetical protein